MTTIPAELDRTPVSRTAPPETAGETNRLHALRSIMPYLCRGALALVPTLVLTSILFYEGVCYIRGSSRMLMPSVLNNSLPQAFLIIGFWALALLALAILCLVILYKTGKALYEHYPKPVKARGKADGPTTS